jgi:uncharacterized membrane protein YhaH (DUF805 family)
MSDIMATQPPGPHQPPMYDDKGQYVPQQHPTQGLPPQYPPQGQYGQLPPPFADDEPPQGQIPPAPKPGSLQSIWDFCIDIVTNHYADGSGTATRREFWTFWLAKAIVVYGSLIIFAPAGVILGLGLIVPALALGARRLHETGRSGWWQALQIIPLLGWIIVVVMLCQPAKVTASSSSSGPTAPTSGATPRYRWE